MTELGSSVFALRGGGTVPLENPGLGTRAGGSWRSGFVFSCVCAELREGAEPCFFLGLGF